MLRKQVARRKIPFVKIGRLVRFDLAEIEAWIKEQKVPVLKGEEAGPDSGEDGGLDVR
jgi:hypothetical protein